MGTCQGQKKDIKITASQVNFTKIRTVNTEQSPRQKPDKKSLKSRGALSATLLQTPVEITTQKARHHQPCHKIQYFDIFRDGNFTQAYTICSNYKIGIDYQQLEHIQQSFIAQHNHSGQTRQVKLVDVKQFQQSELQKLQELSHPNVVSLKEYYYDDQYLYLISDHLKGDNLAQILRYSNYSVEQLLLQILSGLNYLHSNGIIHGNLCPQSIISYSQNSQLIALVGFSLYASQYKALEYQSPEKTQSQSADMWSCGILLYQLIVGDVPFHDEEGDFQTNLSTRGLSAQEIKNISGSPYENLITRLLYVDPNMRPTASQCLALFKHSKNNIQEINLNIKFQKISKLSVILYSQILFHLVEKQQYEELALEFYKQTLYSDGKLPQSLIKDQQIIDKVNKCFDTKADWCLNFHEYLILCLDPQLISEVEIGIMFKMLTQSNYLSAKQLVKLFHQGQDYVNTLIQIEFDFKTSITLVSGMMLFIVQIK